MRGMNEEKTSEEVHFSFHYKKGYGEGRDMESKIFTYPICDQNEGKGKADMQ